MRNILLALAVALCPRVALSLSIGISADPAGTDCNLVIPYPGGAITAYVVGTIDDGAPDGVVAASFRIGGLPDGWTASVSTVDPDANLVFGDPFGDGVILAYPSSVVGDRLLLTLSIHPTSAVENGTLVILPQASASAPSCGFEGAPCVVACPRFCAPNGFGLDCLCVESRTGTINGSPCLVSAESTAWSKVKKLYR